MERTGHKGLPLILAREFAANVAVPIFLVDRDNTLVYYNDAGAVAFGAPFGESGEIKHGEWLPKFKPTLPDGTPVERGAMPLVIALEEQRPAHAVHEVTAPDGGRRLVEFSALPLFSSPDDFVGVMVAFWEADSASWDGKA